MASLSQALLYDIKNEWWGDVITKHQYLTGYTSYLEQRREP